MRLFWTLFLAGILVGGLFSRLYKESQAANPPAKNQKINDPSISGIRVDVPGSAEAESALAVKEKEIGDREKRIKEQEEQLKIEEERLQARLEELSHLRDEVTENQKKNKQESDVILARLVKTFENMAPKKASGVIATMNDDLAVELFLAMKEKKVAAVLEVMDPNRAMTLSSLVARRRPAGRAVGETEAH